jgi:hypothetical protein
LGFAPVSTQPEFGVVVEVTVVAQPAAFRKVQAGGATDGVEFSGVVYGRQEFSDDKTFGRLLEMFAEAPPPEIVNLFDLAIRAFEERNVVLQPGP